MNFKQMKTASVAMERAEQELPFSSDETRDEANPEGEERRN